MQLRRACRIALMELDRPASPEDICERILKRGSYCFEDHTDLHLEVAKVLKALESRGEVELLRGVPPGWRRRMPEESAPGR